MATLLQGSPAQGPLLDGGGREASLACCRRRLCGRALQPACRPERRHLPLLRLLLLVLLLRRQPSLGLGEHALCSLPLLPLLLLLPCANSGHLQEIITCVIMMTILYMKKPAGLARPARINAYRSATARTSTSHCHRVLHPSLLHASSIGIQAIAYLPDASKTNHNLPHVCFDLYHPIVLSDCISTLLTPSRV